MTQADSASFTTGDYVSLADESEVTNASWWNFGKEIWCNMEGQYTTIVADLTTLTGAYEMSLCNVGIMGTKYERIQVIESTMGTGSG